MDKIINKKALVEIVAEKMNRTKKDAAVAVDTVFEEITNVLAEGGKADIAGFGKFEVSERPARHGHQSGNEGKDADPGIQGAEVQGEQDAEGRSQIIRNILR